MLGKHIEPAGAKVLAVALALIDRILGRGCLEKLESVARYEQRAAGLIKPVVGAPDPLEQAA